MGDKFLVLEVGKYLADAVRFHSIRMGGEHLRGRLLFAGLIESLKNVFFFCGKS